MVIGGPAHDLMVEENVRHLLARIRRRDFAGVWLGTPCNSFTRARRGKPGPGGWPAPLRSREHPDGLPDLVAADSQRVAVGNRLAEVSCRVIRECIRRRIPVIIENPGSSFLWDCSVMKRLCEDTEPREQFWDCCAAGCPWRKRTRIRGWCIELRSIGSLCVVRGGLCAYTGRKHLQLSGTCPDGRLWTTVAQAYPRRICQDIATAYVSEFQHQLSQKMWAASRP